MSNVNISNSILVLLQIGTGDVVVWKKDLAFHYLLSLYASVLHARACTVLIFLKVA